MGKGIHDLYRIIHRLGMDIVGIDLFLVFVPLDLVFDTFGKRHISGMPWPCSHDMPFQRSSYQCQISNHIQQFMSCGFILIPQLNVVQDAFIRYSYFFVKQHLELVSSSLLTSLSTITIALDKSPPLIKLFFTKASNSCKKQNVREEEISLLNSSILLMEACWLPNTGELKSIIQVKR